MNTITFQCPACSLCYSPTVQRAGGEQRLVIEQGEIRWNPAGLPVWLCASCVPLCGDQPFRPIEALINQPPTVIVTDGPEYRRIAPEDVKVGERND